MSTWLYPMDGSAPQYYTDGTTIYDRSGEPKFYISDRWAYSYADGRAAFWIDGKNFYEGEQLVFYLGEAP
jgi:hypothetical protein